MDYNVSYKLYIQARKHLDDGDLEGAITLFAKSNALYTHYKTLELWGECEIKLGNYQKAIRILIQAVNLNHSAKPKSLLALAYKNSGEILKSKDLASEVLSSDPNNKICIEVLNQIKTMS